MSVFCLVPFCSYHFCKPLYSLLYLATTYEPILFLVIFRIYSPVTIIFPGQHHFCLPARLPLRVVSAFLTSVNNYRIHGAKFLKPLYTSLKGPKDMQTHYNDILCNAAVSIGEAIRILIQSVNPTLHHKRAPLFLLLLQTEGLFIYPRLKTANRCFTHLGKQLDRLQKYLK